MEREASPSPGAACDGRADRSVALSVAVPFAAYLLFVCVKLLVYHGDVSRFIGAGDFFVSAKDLSYPIAIKPHSYGYDGQFFYRLALDPWSTQPVAHGIAMEVHPTVRVQRILYPALVWLLTFGHAGLVPWMLVLVNLLATSAIGWTALRLAAHAGIPTRLALLLPFYPGFILSLASDTAEIVSTALGLAAVLSAAKDRFYLAALLAAAAVLTRETTLLYLAGFGLVAVAAAIARRRPDRRIACCLAPLVVFLCWQAFLRRTWGGVPFGDLGSHDLSPVPFLGYAQWVGRFAGLLVTLPFAYRHLFDLVLCLAVGAFGAFLFVMLSRSAWRPAAFVIPWLLYAALATLFTGAIWNEPQGFLRILCDFYALGIAALIAARNAAALRRLAPFVVAGWVATFAYAL